MEIIASNSCFVWNLIWQFHTSTQCILDEFTKPPTSQQVPFYYVFFCIGFDFCFVCFDFNQVTYRGYTNEVNVFLSSSSQQLARIIQEGMNSAANTSSIHFVSFISNIPWVLEQVI